MYGLALEDRGKEAVLGKIGVEPTGDAFNSISLESSTGRPLNPMINALSALFVLATVAFAVFSARLRRDSATEPLSP
mgnify:CR=1 FL=1